MQFEHAHASLQSMVPFVTLLPVNSESDEVLMARFCDGNQSAFDSLFSRHAAPLRRYLARFSGSIALADDLTQAAFLSVVRARGRFEQGQKFKPWLYAIATNVAKDTHRRRKHETLVAEVEPTEVGELFVRDRGLEKAMRTALSQLPEAQRSAIVMHRFEGLSFAEIAQAEGASESTVKVRAHRGYEKLRELLRDIWKEIAP
jgi:RNA polymerase sigma factor (sigma-70 family)